MQTLYTAETLATGAGREGHVRTTDGRIDLDLARRPTWASRRSVRSWASVPTTRAASSWR